ncbi:MAG: FAD-binding oxidoreductase, partial [Bacteroidales bacterium]
LELSLNCLLYDEFIMREFDAGRIDRELFTKKHAKIVLHGHCHQKSLASVEASARMLSIPVNYSVETLPTGCCGMAGSFGYEKEHYKYSMEIGEQQLFPLVRKYSAEAIVAAPGTSCRQQILDGTGQRAYHPVELLRDALLCEKKDEQ